MQLNDFYHIVEQHNQTFEIQMNPNHPIYAAHIPDQPITPGVCFVQIAEDLLSCITSPIRIVAVSSLKLLLIHQPNISLSVHFNHIGDNTAKVSFQNNQHTFATVSFLFKRV